MSTTALTNRAFRLRKRPVGAPAEGDLELVSEPVPELADGQILVRTLYLSLDPTNRLWMSDMRQYSPPVELDEVMRGIGIGEGIDVFRHRRSSGPGRRPSPAGTLSSAEPSPQSKA